MAGITSNLPSSLHKKQVFAGNFAIAIALGLSRFDFGIVARLMQHDD